MVSAYVLCARQAAAMTTQSLAYWHGMVACMDFLWQITDGRLDWCLRCC